MGDIESDLSTVKANRRHTRSRAELLTEISGLPDGTYVTGRYAAAYLDTTEPVLGNWRSQRRGPEYVGNGRFIRYRISALKAFMGE
jgi:hypothetical protein